MTDSETAFLDAESEHGSMPPADRPEIRLWLRLLTCTLLMEGNIRRKLRHGFGVTLPRFDLMAQLQKAPDGMTLGELSRRMMVSNGNLTGLVERLVASKHLDLRPSPNDRRAQIVRLTEEGRREFTRMAEAHEEWLGDMMAGLSRSDTESLMRMLAKLKRSAQKSIKGDLKEKRDGKT